MQHSTRFLFFLQKRPPGVFFNIHSVLLLHKEITSTATENRKEKWKKSPTYKGLRVLQSTFLLQDPLKRSIWSDATCTTKTSPSSCAAAERLRGNAGHPGHRLQKKTSVVCTVEQLLYVKFSGVRWTSSRTLFRTKCLRFDGGVYELWSEWWTRWATV